MTTKESFATKLHALRREKKMTRKELSEASNISQTQLYHIESGHHSPTLNTVDALVRVFPELKLTFKVN